MPRNISDLYQLARFIVRKEIGVFILPNGFASNLDNGQMDAFEEYFKLNGVNQEVHDALRVFRTTAGFITNVDGTVGYQTNYMHLLGSPYTITGSTINEITFVDDATFKSAMVSQLRAVDTSYPIALENSAGFTVYPNLPQQTGSYNYLKRPNTPVFGYTQVGRVITYNPLTSTQLQWVEVYWNNILAKTLVYYGVYMNEEGVYKYAELYNEQTKP